MHIWIWRVENLSVKIVGISSSVITVSGIWSRSSEKLLLWIIAGAGWYSCNG